MRRLEKLVGAGILTAAVGFAAFEGVSLTQNKVDGSSQNPGGRTPNALDLGSPAPTAVDLGGSPMPEASQSPEAGNVEWHHVDALTSYEVQPGDLFVGDSQMSDTADSQAVVLYDQDTHKAADVTDNTKTALYVDVKAPGVIYAEWGGDVATGMTDAQKLDYLAHQEGPKQQAGFNVIDVVTWTGADSTVTQGDLTTHFWVEGQSIPTATESPLPTNDALLQELLAMDPSTMTLDQKFQLEELKTLVEIQACTCGTGSCPLHSPMPSETPVPSATPTPEATCGPMNDFEINSGETFRTKADKNYIIQGDILIDGKKYYDSNQNTFAVDEVFGAHVIKAPYGADIQEFCVSDTTFGDVYVKDVNEGKATNRSFDNNSGTVK